MYPAYMGASFHSSIGTPGNSVTRYTSLSGSAGPLGGIAASVAAESVPRATTSISGAASNRGRLRGRRWRCGFMLLPAPAVVCCSRARSRRCGPTPSRHLSWRLIIEMHAVGVSVSVSVIVSGDWVASSHTCAADRDASRPSNHGIGTIADRRDSDESGATNNGGVSSNSETQSGSKTISNPFYSFLSLSFLASVARWYARMCQPFEGPDLLLGPHITVLSRSIVQRNQRRTVDMGRRTTTVTLLR